MKNLTQEKKKFQSSFDNSFLEESKSGNQAIDLFLDRANPYNKVFLALLNIYKKIIIPCLPCQPVQQGLFSPFKYF